MKLFLLEPEIVFQAQVNQISFSYPISQVSYDNAVGNFGDLERGLTILFGSSATLDDLGKSFVGPTEATASTLYFNRSSQGKREGEVSLSDNVHITVLNDYRVWPKVPHMPDGETHYKWGVLLVGDNTTYTPPVANAGVPTAGDVDSVTGKLHAQFPHASPNESFVTTEGATITGYAWELPTGVALSPGFALTDPVIEVDADPGFYWLTLTVTDSNGKTHQARTFILAIDPANDPCITNLGNSTLRRSKESQTLSVEVFEDVSKLNFPDGTLAIFIDGNPSTQDDRSNVLFWGWHQSDPASVSSQREGFLGATTMTFVDVAGRLDVIPGFPQVIENEDIRDPEAHPTITWSHMVDPTLDKFIHYLLHWHSTALDLTDYIPSLTTTTFPIGGTIGSQGGTLWQQVTSRAKAFVPKRNIGCDKYGRLVVHLDPMLADVAQRTPLVQESIGTDDVARIQWTAQQTPKYHWIRGSAIQAIDPLPLDENGDFTIPTFFCIAPGTAPGFGASEMSVGEQLAVSQNDLNVSTGHEYARQNAPTSLFDIELANPFSNTYYRHLDPVNMQWVVVTLEPQYSAQRGLALGAERGQLHEVVYEHRALKEGVGRKTTLRWERETIGDPAITVEMPDVPKSGDPYVPPDPGEGAFLPNLPSTQEELLVVLSGKATVSNYIALKTADFQTPASSGGPTWAGVTVAGITDSDFYSWVVDPFSPGYVGLGTAINGWIVGPTELVYIEDFFGTPSATAQLTFSEPIPISTGHGWRTVQSSFGRYFATEANNPWLMVVSHYGNNPAKPGTWCHYSVDAGQTWNESQISPYFYTTDPVERLPLAVWMSPRTPGLAFAAAYSASGDPAESVLYVTYDWGATWEVATSSDGSTNPAMPYLAMVSDGVVAEVTQNGMLTVSSEALAISSGTLEVVTGPDVYIVMIAPSNAVRVEISGQWSATRSSDAGSFGFITNIDEPPVPNPLINLTENFTFVTPAANASTEGTFSLTYAKNPWPTNAASLTYFNANPTAMDFPRQFMETSASANGGGATYSQCAVTWEITEVELNDATIYNPVRTVMSPINNLAGSIHVPWENNLSESLLYYGKLTDAATLQYRLEKVLSGVFTDISPSNAAISYGCNRYGFGIRAYDSNKQYLVVGAMGNDMSLNNTDDKHAIFVSSDGGATWTMIVGPSADSVFAFFRGYSAAFASDSPNSIYIWGEPNGGSRCIAFTSDFGATVDDRRGNMNTILSIGDIDTILGIAGGAS